MASIKNVVCKFTEYDLHNDAMTVEIKEPIKAILIIDLSDVTFDLKHDTNNQPLCRFDDAEVDALNDVVRNAIEEHCNEFDDPALLVNQERTIAFMQD